MTRSDLLRDARAVLGLLLLISPLTSGCVTTSRVTDRGARIQLVNAGAVTHCRSLGFVSGTGGGAFGGAWISNADLIRYAMNDLRNRAGELGATHVVVSPPSMAANQEGNITTAVVTGAAYSCVGGSLRRRQARAGRPAAPKGPAAGSERGPCYGNGTCNAGLQCASGLCVRLPAVAPAPPTTPPPTLSPPAPPSAPPPDPQLAPAPTNT